jgi:phenylpropionate dioxygenase-like ring-hydroxylating dioxygenase large terminal subunit
MENPMTNETGYGRIGVVPQENTELTHVGFGTAMGEVLRRYWQPVALSEELEDLPKAVRILGEDLVVFRDGSGRVGLLDRHCSHRGASLEYGKIESDGIRCCYHGWLYNVEGRCLQQPGEPPTSKYKDRIGQPWYPAREFGGLVFAYMGPPDRMPEFPMYDILCEEGAVLTAYRNVSRGVVAECNWLQIQENAMDPVHTAFLHATISGAQFSEVFAALPELDFEETSTGMTYIRRSSLPNGLKYRRVQETFVPNARSVPDPYLDADTPMRERSRVIGWWVPVDDFHTIGFHIEVLRVVDGKPVPSMMEKSPVGRSSGTQPARQSYEDTQREPDDMEAQCSQRPIVVHAKEHLATTDRGVVLYRRLLRNALKAVKKGEDPAGIIRDPNNRTVKVSAENTLSAD